jgi:hypothetical protein
MTDEFIQRCLRDAADFGLFLAGQPEQAALLALHDTRERMAADLIEEFGDDAARLIAEAFAATVVRVKAGIEEASVGTKGTVQ